MPIYRHIDISTYQYTDIPIYRYTDIATHRHTTDISTCRYRYTDISTYRNIGDSLIYRYIDISIYRYTDFPKHGHTDIQTYRYTDISSKVNGIRFNTFRARGHLVPLVGFPTFAPKYQKTHKSGKVLGPPLAARRAQQHSPRRSIWASPWEPCPGPLQSYF